MHNGKDRSRFMVLESERRVDPNYCIDNKNCTHLALPDPWTFVVVEFGIHVHIYMIFIIQLLV
jgi:hypothetical protein